MPNSKLIFFLAAVAFLGNGSIANASQSAEEAGFFDGFWRRLSSPYVKVKDQDNPSAYREGLGEEKLQKAAKKNRLKIDINDVRRVKLVRICVEENNCDDLAFNLRGFWHLTHKDAQEVAPDLLEDLRRYYAAQKKVSPPSSTRKGSDASEDSDGTHTPPSPSQMSQRKPQGQK